MCYYCTGAAANTPLTARGSWLFQTEPSPGWSEEIHYLETRLVNKPAHQQIIAKDPCFFKHIRALWAGCAEIHLCHCCECVCLKTWDICWNLLDIQEKTHYLHCSNQQKRIEASIPKRIRELQVCRWSFSFVQSKTAYVFNREFMFGFYSLSALLFFPFPVLKIVSCVCLYLQETLCIC